MFKVKMDIPVFKRLRVDRDKVNAKVANRAALLVRKRLKKGEDADGPLPKAEDGGPILNDSGRLIKSVKQRKAKRGDGRIVRATGQRERGKRNAAIMAIQIAKKDIDPLGLSVDMTEDLAKVMNREINRQVRAGKLGLVHELRRIKG